MGTRLAVFRILLALIFVVSSASFVWSEGETGSAITLSDVKTLEGLAQVGGQLFDGKGNCAACHSVGAAPSDTGPTLKGVGAQLTQGFIYESLVNPDAYVYLDFAKTPPAPYAVPMPPTSLDDGEIFAVIAYLQQLSGEPISVKLSDLK